MFKKRIWRHILIGFAWVITLGGLVVLMSFIEFKKSGVVCKDVKAVSYTHLTLPTKRIV